MEINNFVNMEFLAGFGGTIVGVELIVYCTKQLPYIKKIPTRIYTFVLALIHLLIVKCVMGNFELGLGSVYLLIINSLLISTLLCGGYDVALGNIQIPQMNGKKRDINIGIDDNNHKNGISNDNINSETQTTVNEDENASIINRGRNSNINDKTP